MNNSVNGSKVLNDLCNSQPLAVLATAAGTAPYASLVAIALAADLRRLYFATPRATHKCNNLADNKQVAVLIDNRSNQPADFSQASAATLLGSAKELTGPEKNAGLEIYLARHPHLTSFINSPDAAFFMVLIEHIQMVNGFNDITELHFET